MKVKYYVSPTGNNGWSGKFPSPNFNSTDGPFATLERARDEIRKLKTTGELKNAIDVILRGGVYFRDKTFELTSDDSGTANTPITYVAFPGEEVHLTGGKTIGSFRPVTNNTVFARLDESARNNVLETNLRAQGITDFGGVINNRLELFFQDRPMTPARWPNDGFTSIVDVVESSQSGKFTYEGDRPKRWAGEKDIWLHGYWNSEWSEQRHKVEYINTEQRIISLVPPYHTYGYRKGQWFYAFNLLAELDCPGEWYLDRETGILYFWPPASLKKEKTVVSVPQDMVTMQNTSYITIRGVIIEAMRGNAVTIKNGTQNRIAGCTIRNVGISAVAISGGAANGVADCDIYEIGAGGILLEGGDRKTLVPAGHYAENNHIHHYGRWNPTYCPAVFIQGVGNRVAHNLIHDAPHQAIAFEGNDHVIEFNEIYNVCRETNDAGVIYSGRNWTWRGTVVRYNFIHHIAGLKEKGCIGVYLDDLLSGTTIYGNVFYKVTTPVAICGGRDNVVENNVFVDCVPALHVDARGLGWAANWPNEWSREGRDKGTLLGISYKQPPYSERYPKLPGILEDEPAAPKGNIIAENICWGGRWTEVEDRAQPYLTFRNNLVGQDPHFADAVNMNFQLKDDSPAYKLGFTRIPIEKIGLYKAE